MLADALQNAAVITPVKWRILQRMVGRVIVDRAASVGTQRRIVRVAQSVALIATIPFGPVSRLWVLLEKHQASTTLTISVLIRQSSLPDT